MNSRITMFLSAAIVLLSCFVVVYLRLYFFRKQNIEVARFSQRIMTFVMDMGMLNFIALFVGVLMLFPSDFTSYLGPGKLNDLIPVLKAPIRDYVMQMQEFGGWYLWSDLRILEAFLITVCMIYYVVMEGLRSSGSIGRKNSETVLTHSLNREKVSFGRIVIRGLVKFVPLILATYWTGLLGVFAYAIVLFCVYKINVKGKMPHDFLSNTVVLRSHYLD